MGGGRRSLQEQILESREFKIERLKALTRIEDEDEFQKIFYELTEVIDGLEAHQVEVRNIRDSEGKLLSQNLNFYELTSDEEQKIQTVLDKLKIQAFPEPSGPGKNTRDLFIEDRWGVEIFRLLKVFDYAEGKDEREKRLQDFIKEQKEFEERRAEAEAKREAQAEAFRLEQIRQAAEKTRYLEKEVSAQMDIWRRRQTKAVTLEEIESQKEFTEMIVRLRYDVENSKVSQREKDEIRKLIADKQIDRLLEEIKTQKFTVEEEEERLRETSPVDMLHGYGNLQNVIRDRRSSKGRYQSHAFLYDENMVEDVDANLARSTKDWLDDVMQAGEVDDYNLFSEWQDDKLAERMVQIEKESPIWNQYLPNLKLFQPRTIMWLTEGKRGKVLRAAIDIIVPELGLNLKKGDIISKDLRETIFIQSKGINSEDLQERKLARKAMDITIQINLGLILHFIKDLKYFSPSTFKNIPGDDMLTLGLLGILSAVENYDPTMEKKTKYHVGFLASYIEGSLRGVDSGDYDFRIGQVNVPGHIVQTQNKLNKIREIVRRTFPDKSVDEGRVKDLFMEEDIPMTRELGYQKTLEVIQDIYEEIPHQQIGEEIEARLHDVDMLGNYLFQEQPNLDSLVKEELKRAISKILQTFTPREERVVRMRFGIGIEDEHTLEEVANTFGVTKERIRQIEMKVIRRIKHPSKSRLLQNVIE